MNGTIYLIPCNLGDENFDRNLPSFNLNVVNTISHFIVENTRTARRFLKAFGIQTPINELRFYEIGKHSNSSDYPSYLKPAENGEHIGILSEAGCPGIADPGSDIVQIAHQKGLPVVPLIGPSSITLSLMASGMNGQSFAFHGYLPIKSERKKAIKQLEDISGKLKQTQLFIEAPYRNDALLEDILTVCSANTRVCVACDITLESEYIVTKTVTQWKKKKPSLHKRPVIFLIAKF